MKSLFCDMCNLTLKDYDLPSPAVISNTPQVSVTEYNKLQAEIRQLKRDLQVSNKMKTFSYVFGCQIQIGLPRGALPNFHYFVHY